MTRISITVDGVRHEDDVEPRLLLVHYLRDRVGKSVRLTEKRKEKVEKPVTAAAEKAAPVEKAQPAELAASAT